MPKGKKAAKAVDPAVASVNAANREDKLKRLASARVSKAAKYISLCGNLANYKPTEEQSKRIISALDTAVESVEKRLTSSPGQATQSFTL